MSEIIYILTNPHMPKLALMGYFDVGTLEKEMERLYSEGVPDFFECEYAAEVANADKIEEEIRQEFANDFVSHERGFFKKESIAKIKMTIQKQQIKNIVLGNNEETSSREMFDFYKVGIKKGTVLNFIKNPTIVCVVHDSKKVEFQGRVKHFSNATKEAYRIIGEPTAKEAYRGNQHWSYEGEQLLRLWNDYQSKKR